MYKKVGGTNYMTLYGGCLLHTLFALLMCTKPQPPLITELNTQFKVLRKAEEENPIIKVISSDLSICMTKKREIQQKLNTPKKPHK